MPEFTSGPSSLLRIVLTAAIAYPFLVLVLRTSGKRTISKFNAFDLIITVALGSTLASVITSRDLPILDGLSALLCLVALQFAASFVAVRWDAFDQVLKSEPTVLLRDGQQIGSAMKRERVTAAEIRAAVREAGAERLEEAAAVFLESDGSLSVILRGE